MKYRLALLLVLLAATTASASDWSHWRGPEQNGVARDRHLPEKFSLDPKNPNNLVWRVPYGGRTTPIIQNGRVYAINKTGEGVTEQERVLCFDAKDGKVLWEHKFNVWLTDIVSDRLGWTNMCGDPETGNVYAHGTQGLLIGFDKDGKIVWQHSLTEEYGRVSGYGGRVTSPIVDGDLVIIGMVNASWGDQAIGGVRFAAFDKKTGAVAWWGSAGLRVKDTYNSVPAVGVIGGQRLLISGGGDGAVHAFKVRTGEKVWSYVFGDGAVNCSPVIDGDRVYIGHGEENEGTTQGRVICLDGAKVVKGEPKLIWKVDGIKVKFASPILYEKKLIVCDEIANMYGLDADTGATLWTYNYGRNTKGSPVLADGKLYVGEVDSRFHILRLTDAGPERLYRHDFRRPRGGVASVELNGSPAVADGKIFFFTNYELICIGKKDTPQSDPIPPRPVEQPLPANAKPAVLRVFPADVAVNPKDKVPLSAVAYDAEGRLIGPVEVQWSAAPMRPPEYPKGMVPPRPPAGQAPPAAPPVLQGDLAKKAGKETQVTLKAMPLNQFGRVVAKLGNLTGECRVRVAARIPFDPDFSRVPEGRTPGGWVNTQGKFAVVTKGGKKVLRKLTANPSPLVAKANAYIGLPNYTDYAIEADVMGEEVQDKNNAGQVVTYMPDLGIIANRYTLQLSGNKQELRILSWEAVPRVDQTIGFSWKPNVWYRLRLVVDVQSDKATIRGKAWPRDQSEPADWMLEFVDPSPNREGAPALYGYATGTTANKLAGIYYDNVHIRPNKK